MVGFIWLVFTPTQPTLQSLEDSITNLTTATSFNADDLLGADTIFSSQESIGQASQTTKSSPRKSSRRKKLSGPIIPRQLKSSSSNLSSRSDKSSSKEWPEKGRGQIVLDHSSYNRVHDLLLRLDFSDLNAATSSTRKWLGEVTAITAPAADWGKEINGAYQVGNQTAVAGQAATPTSGQVNDLSGMLIRKKRKNAGDEAQPPAAVDTPAINVLGAAMIRKKPKVSNSWCSVLPYLSEFAPKAVVNGTAFLWFPGRRNKPLLLESKAYRIDGSNPAHASDLLYRVFLCSCSRDTQNAILA
jgi:regulator of Ty1 transposition protein 109